MNACMWQSALEQSRTEICKRDSHEHLLIRGRLVHPGRNLVQLGEMRPAEPSLLGSITWKAFEGSTPSDRPSRSRGLTFDKLVVNCIVSRAASACCLTLS